MLDTALCWLWLAATPAPPTVATAPVSVTGDGPADRPPALQAAFDAGIRKSAVQPIAAGASCETSDCHLREAREAGAPFLVSARVEATLREYTMHVEARSTDTNAVVVSLEESCAPCGLAEAAEVLEGVTATLADKLRSRVKTAPTLIVTSTPPHAVIRIDDTVAGTTPVTSTLTPGSHVVDARKAGYASRRYVINSEAGVEDTLNVRLSRDYDRPPRAGRGLLIAGASLLGAGGAASIAGFTLVGLHGRPDRDRCEGSNIDGDGDCRFVLDSLPLGASLAATGLAAVAVGTALLVVRHRRRKR